MSNKSEETIQSSEIFIDNNKNDIKKNEKMYIFLSCIISIIILGIIIITIYGIIITSKSISNYPKEWETCHGGYNLRVFIIGALINFCSANLSLISPIIWVFMGHNWLYNAKDYKYNDNLLYESVYKSWILICIGSIINIIIYIILCLRCCLKYYYVIKDI